jgi:photosystem II stability/assembly factor-like uncharacterized protein
MRILKFNLILILLTLCCFSAVSAQWVDYELGTGLFPNDVVFVNENTGWLCGNNGYVAKTTNKGVNWANQTVQADMHFECVHFFNENTGIIFGEDSYRTTNAGLNWNFIPSLDARFVQCVSFIDGLTGWAATLFGRIYKTTDGGVTWSFQVDLGGSGFGSIAGVNSSIVFATRSNTIYKTTNGGTNWNSLIYIPDAGFGNITFSDENNGKAFGTYLFYKTTNGGQNWLEWDLPAGGTPVRDKFFLDNSTGWVTTAAKVYYTENGGAFWQEQTSGTLQGNAIYYGNNILCVVGRITAQNLAIARISTTGGFNLTPPSLTASRVSSSQINLSWTDNSNDEEYFLIERSPNGATGWVQIDSLGGGNTAYQNTGLNSDQAYYYRIRCRKNIFYSSYSNVASARTYMNSPALSFPANDAVYPSAVPLAWSTVTNGFFYTLQVGSDSNFSNIVYSTTTTGTNATPDNVISSHRYHWRVKTSKLDGSNESQYSAHRSFWILNPNYGSNMQSGDNLYYFANSTAASNPAPSKPVYNWRDTTGSIDLMLNGTVMHPIYGGSNEGRFDITGQLPPGNSVRFFGINYQDIYIGTNGIIGFTPFNPAYFAPWTALPQSNITNAIFAFWNEFEYFTNPISLNRVCYKITSNEIIITYIRPISVIEIGTDPNNYVSFQVILSHSPSPSINSNISIMYSYDQTSSNFINRYNNDSLRTYMIGLQGSNSSSQFLQYRYLNDSAQLITNGPMFGSNMALQFGPNVNLLPVELASFTSSVNGSNVKLNWSTVSEQNNSGFDIERKNANENNWKKINFVQGNGTTNEAKNYSYEDKNLSSGKYLYRLKQIDFNGNYEYHALQNEVEIGVPKKFNLSQNYPNPFNPVTKINFELPRTSKVKLFVYDITGKLASELVNEQRAAGYYTVEFNGANLASGTYFYVLEAGDFKSVKKMVLIK